MISAGYQVYACGAPAMVEAAHKDFTRLRRLPEDEFFSDAFTASPSEPKVLILYPALARLMSKTTYTKWRHRVIPLPKLFPKRFQPLQSKLQSLTIVSLRQFQSADFFV